LCVRAAVVADRRAELRRLWLAGAPAWTGLGFTCDGVIR
jgi:hypothetical protein